MSNNSYLSSKCGLRKIGFYSFHFIGFTMTVQKTKFRTTFFCFVHCMCPHCSWQFFSSHQLEGVKTESETIVRNIYQNTEHNNCYNPRKQHRVAFIWPLTFTMKRLANHKAERRWDGAENTALHTTIFKLPGVLESSISLGLKHRSLVLGGNISHEAYHLSL